MEEIPDPVAPPGHVVVRVRATALNHLDVWTREGLPGLSLEWPHILGADVAGELDGERVLVSPGLSCGVCERCLSGRDNLCRQYRILGEHVRGAHAEKVVVPRANLLPFPAGLSFEEAAAIPLVFLTAWQMIARKGRVRPGETVLVWAAGSGVGSAALQVAKLHGATVIATAGTAAKLARAKALGADHAVLHTDVATAVKEITKKRGVDVVVEHVGAATWETSLRALAWGGRLVTCGATSGWDAKTDLRHVFYRQLDILGSTMGSKADLFEVVRHVEAKRLRPVVDRVLPLERAADGHRALEARETFGKIVLVP
jgi:NADPH:quinone reductase-like Zn-dependent oxidoreductase